MQGLSNPPTVVPLVSGMAGTSFVPLLPAVDAVTAQKQEQQARDDAAAARMATEPIASTLLSYLKSCKQSAIDAKDNSKVTEQLLDAQRRRTNQHSPENAAKIAKAKLPNYWVPLTQTKCIHTEAWMRDLLLPYGDKIWACEPTALPDVPSDKVQELSAKLREEAGTLMQAGVPIEPEQFAAMLDKEIANYRAELEKEARDKARLMEKLIQDQQQEGGWSDVFREFMSNVVTYGTGFLKGPFTRQVKKAAWQGNQRVVGDAIVPVCSAPSPHDIFPAPWAKTEQDGYIIERIKTYRAALNSVRKLKYYQRKNIEDLLLERVVPAATDQQGDSTRAEHEQKSSEPDDRIECWSFHGKIAGYMLEEFGLDEIDPVEDYEVEVLWSGDKILKVMPYWNDIGVRPYFRAVFKSRIGSFWGIGVPHLMSASQDRANAIMIAELDNAAWGSGPMCWLDITRMVNPKDALTLGPRKVFITRNDKQETSPPVQFFTVDLKVAELDRLYQGCLTDADNESGVPAYMYGSDKAAGAGSTYSGLATLMNSAARGIKDALIEIDVAVSKLISNWADWNNEYAEDDAVKGDIRIISSGATGLFVQEMQIQRMGELLDRTANPADMEMLGPQFRLGLLRKMATMLKIDTSNMPTEDELAMRIEQIKAAGQSLAADVGNGATAQGAAVEQKNAPQEGAGQ